MTTVFRASGPAQFLAALPSVLGYLPTRSLVLVPFARGRTLGGLRLDLPEDVGREEAERLASTFIGLVCKVSEADAVAVVVYTDGMLAGPEGPAHETLVRALLRRADLCGLRPTDALCVAADAWGSYVDPGRARRPLAEIAALDALPAAVGDQTTGVALPPATPADRERAAAATTALVRALEALCGVHDARPRGAGEAPTDGDDERGDDGERIDPRALAATAALDDLPALFEDALRWDLAEVDAFSSAVLVWCLDRPALRDVALLQWSSDLAAGDEALDAQARWEEGEDYPAELATTMWGEGARPDPDRLERALELARHAASLAPPPHRAGPLAAAAWLSWALGRSSHAARYAEWAEAAQPGHGLAGIVAAMVAGGHLPEWAFTRPGPRATT